MIDNFYRPWLRGFRKELEFPNSGISKDNGHKKEIKSSMQSTLHHNWKTDMITLYRTSGISTRNMKGFTQLLEFD